MSWCIVRFRSVLPKPKNKTLKNNKNNNQETNKPQALGTHISCEREDAHFMQCMNALSVSKRKCIRRDPPVPIPAKTPRHTKCFIDKTHTL